MLMLRASPCKDDKLALRLATLRDPVFEALPAAPIAVWSCSSMASSSSMSRILVCSWSVEVSSAIVTFFAFFFFSSFSTCAEGGGVGSSGIAVVTFLGMRK